MGGGGCVNANDDDDDDVDDSNVVVDDVVVDCVEVEVVVEVVAYGFGIVFNVVVVVDDNGVNFHDGPLL
jgi:hypothetical protein